MVGISTVKNLEQKLTLNRYLLLHRVLLCLVILLGVALRFYDLGTESYWLDEVLMVRAAERDLESILLDMRENGRPPVYVLLAHFWMQVFGTSEAATRSLSALFSSASLIVMYTVGRELFGRKVGLLSVLLMAISEFQIHNSQNFRYYGLFLFMTLLSFLFLIRALDSGRRAYFVAYVLASILLFFTHTFGVFVLVAQNLFFLFHWNKYRNIRVLWVVSQALILLAVGSRLLRSVLVQTTAAQASGGTTGAVSWIREPPLRAPLRTLLEYIFPSPYLLPDRHYGWDSWVTIATGAAFLISGALLFALWKGKKQWLASARDVVIEVHGVLSSRRSELLLVSCWLLCPIVIPFVLSKVLAPMYVIRYTIGASPALYILLALGITKVRKVIPELVSLGVLMILIAPGLQEYYVMPSREQWRETAAYIEQNAKSGDVIVFAGDPQEIGNAFHWYYQGNVPACDLSHRLRDDAAIADALAQCTSGRERFWLIMRPGLKYMAHLEAFFLKHHHNHIQLVQEEKFQGTSVHLFVLTEQ